MNATNDTFTDYEKRVINALRTVREVSGVDQIPLSLAAGMGRNRVGQIERLERHATLGVLERLLTAAAKLSTRRTNVRTVSDLLAVAEGKITVTIEQLAQDD